jgi:methyl-accepting chemotaxis protein
LSSSASGLLAFASQVAASTAETAAATNESVATVEEVKQMAMLAEEKTAEATELAEDLAERCKHGSQSATRNTGTFGRIHDDMDVVAEAIERLSEQARSVGDIVTAVNDIAEQSNLLSVNASIEAAKAGEHGKGFSVVAQEVKTLAEQSKQAVAQVRIILGEIQKASDVAEQAVVQSRDAVEAGRVESSGAIENTVAELVVASKAVEANQLISQTSRQQLAGMEQISQAMRSISDAGSQAASGTREVEREAQELKELAISLQGIVGGAPE